jgi:hypothetical protein
MIEDGSILHMWSILQMLQMVRSLTYSLVGSRYLFTWVVTMPSMWAFGYLVLRCTTRLYLLADEISGRR